MTCRVDFCHIQKTRDTGLNSAEESSVALLSSDTPMLHYNVLTVHQQCRVEVEVSRCPDTGDSKSWLKLKATNMMMMMMKRNAMMMVLHGISFIVMTMIGLS